MKKIFLLLALLLIPTFFCLNATETRISALGAEENLFIDDDVNIRIYPSSLERYVEKIIVERGFYPYADSLANFLFLKELGKFGNIALVFNKTDIPLFPRTSYQTMIAQPQSQSNIVYSLRIKDALMLGISGGYGIAANNDDEEGSANDITNESSIYSGSFGLSYLLGQAHLLDLSAAMNSYRFKYKQGDNFLFDNDNNLSTGFHIRFLFYLNDYVSMIPFFGYSTKDLSSTEAAFGQITPRRVKRLTTNRKSGLGMNFVPFEENKVTVGIIYKNNVYEQSIAPGGEDTTITDNYLPEVVGGIESQIKSWLIVRAGFQKSFLNHRVQTTNGITSITTDKDAPFKLTAGCGIRLGSISIDGLLNEDFPFTCGYLVSGEQEPVFTKLSATYFF